MKFDSGKDIYSTVFVVVFSFLRNHYTVSTLLSGEFNVFFKKRDNFLTACAIERMNNRKPVKQGENNCGSTAKTSIVKRCQSKVHWVQYTNTRTAVIFTVFQFEGGIFF